MVETVNYIISECGGKFRLTAGIDLIIPLGVLWRNTRIRVRIDEDDTGIRFIFDTDRTKTSLPKDIALVATRQALNGVKQDYMLFYTGDPDSPLDEPVAIEPVTKEVVVVWYINDLASYYLRKVTGYFLDKTANM